MSINSGFYELTEDECIVIDAGRVGMAKAIEIVVKVVIITAVSSFLGGMAYESILGN